MNIVHPKPTTIAYTKKYPEKGTDDIYPEKGTDDINGEHPPPKPHLHCMPRRPRFVLPGTPHHLTQRGNNRQDIFLCKQDRLDYISILQDHSQRHDCRILGWCLMTNHIHLVAVPGNANSLALTLGQAHAQYSLRLNRRKGWVGHVLQNRFFSCPLDAPHLFSALHYIELNPVRAGLVTKAWDWPWSSARAHTSARAADQLLHGDWLDWTEEARLGAWVHADWKASIANSQTAEKADEIRRATKVGEPLGSQAFLGRLEKEAGRRLRVMAQGRPRLRTAELGR